MSEIDLDRLQLSLPRTTSLLLAGPALYLSFIDPEVLGSHTSIKDRLTHWSAMYSFSKSPITALAMISSLLGLNAYRLTEEKLWLWGSLSIFAVIPWTFATMTPVSHELNKDLEDSKKSSAISNSSILERLGNWLSKHKVSTGLALLAAGLFYAAEGKTRIIEFIPIKVIETTESLQFPSISVPVAPAV